MRRDGTYDVQLEGGELRKAVRSANVREAVGPSDAPASPDAITPPASPEEAAAAAAAPSPTRRAFNVGDTVEANCRGLGQYYMGVVTAVLDGGSFRISYTDGDCESGVPERFIRRTQSRRSRAAPKPADAERAPLQPLNKVSRAQPLAAKTQVRRLRTQNLTVVLRVCSAAEERGDRERGEGGGRDRGCERGRG